MPTVSSARPVVEPRFRHCRQHRYSRISRASPFPRNFWMSHAATQRFDRLVAMIGASLVLVAASGCVIPATVNEAPHDIIAPLVRSESDPPLNASAAANPTATKPEP